MVCAGENCPPPMACPGSGERIAGECCTVQEDANNASSYAAQAVKEVISLLSSD